MKPFKKEYEISCGDSKVTTRSYFKAKAIARRWRKLYDKNSVIIVSMAFPRYGTILSAKKGRKK